MPPTYLIDLMKAALVRWELCVHELLKVLSDFEFLSSQVGLSKGKKTSRRYESV